MRFTAWIIFSLMLTPLVRADVGVEFFETRIRPVLAENCYRCHGADKSKAGLKLDRTDLIRKGGDSGPMIVPGKPDESLLIKAIRYKDESLQMPPKKALAAEVVRDFEQWVAAGAPMPAPTTKPSDHQFSTHWAFQRPAAVSPPATVDKGKWAKSPVDAFIVSRLEAAGLSPGPMADRRTLIRRVTEDLTGLPPTPAEVEAFLADGSPDAFAKVVDRLLASPHYGERWGRYWLDVARYADSKGYVFQEERRYPYAYTYRDWVIRSFNEDLPYDQFLIQQIAADRLESKPEGTRPLAAMGFLTVGRRFLNNQPDIIDDRLDVICRGTMGLTIGCARCHDHKFEPISMKDYYGLYGVFASSTEPGDLPPIKPAERNPQTEAFEKELAAKQGDIAAFIKKRHGEILAEVQKPDKLAAHLAAAREVLSAKANPHTLSHERNLRQPVLERIVALLRKSGKVEEVVAPGAAERIVKAAEAGADSPFNIPADQVESLFLRDDREKLAALKQGIDALNVTHPGAPPKAMVMQDLPNPVEPVIFLRGNAGNPGPKVARRFLSLLGGEDSKPFKNGSGRLELAKAIASPENPLTARVMVNRIWLGHFGQGLVRTPSDFGTRGQPPTHPELLDYLATAFVQDGWSIKKLHRRILLSAVYQQSAAVNPVAFNADPENRLLWRQNIRRLDFESTRDSLLFASGRLDETMFGRPLEIGDPGARRRSLYGFIDRQNLPGMFRAFDFASPDAHSPQRFSTTVPQQALFLMNSPFVIEQSKALAARVVATAAPAERIVALYQIALQRAPTRDELEVAQAYIENETAAPTQFAQTLPQRPTWEYGYGRFDEKTSRMTFKRLPNFTGSAWQGGKNLPDSKLGWCLLTSGGGHPGNDADHAVIRRWNCPRDGVVRIRGSLIHNEEPGDGVRARLVSTRLGLIKEWTAHKSTVETKLEVIEVKAGDSLDFVVDCLGGPNSDSFAWSVKVKWNTPGDGPSEYDSTAGFSGSMSPPQPEKPLTPWEKFAQVLLLSNEFAFMD